MKFDLFHPREQLVQIMDRIYRYGLTTTSGGNLSILDENSDLWITPLNTLPIGEAEVQELEEKFG